MTGTARTFPLSGQETVSPTAALTHYEFPPAMLRRAAQEHGWGHAFTERAAHEYRRFLILAAAAGHPVTPSRAVDALWHEHLTFTRDYWERLTPLLPAPLHHEPATGEASDTDFAAQYRCTLDSYARLFGEVAPVDVWPDPTVRAAPATHTATRTAGGVRVSALLLAALAGGVAFLTFLSTRFGVLAALGVFVLALILLTTAQANPTGTGARRDRRDGDGGGADIGGSDGGGSDGGSSCGSSCGGGCSS